MIVESLIAVVKNITFHNSESGWTVLRVSPVASPHEEKLVTVHQALRIT